MATTTATITINSTDLLTDELSLSTTATFTQAGNSTGLTGTGGLGKKTTGNTTDAGDLVWGTAWGGGCSGG